MQVASTHVNIFLNFFGFEVIPVGLWAYSLLCGLWSGIASGSLWGLYLMLGIKTQLCMQSKCPPSLLHYHSRFHNQHLSCGPKGQYRS